MNWSGDIMKVSVKLFSILRLKTGLSQLTVELNDNATVEDLVVHLEDRLGDDFLQIVRKNDYKYGLALVVNGKKVSNNIVLKEGDTVAFIGALSGG